MARETIPETLRAEVDVDALVAAARRVRANAHAPYSKYKVGAALLAGDGRIFLGVNVENSAYPTSLCAEHNAVGTAITEGAKSFKAVAVVTEPKPGTHPGAPCGKCRQALSELGLEVLVILASPNEGDAPELIMLSDLLPRAFTSADL